MKDEEMNAARAADWQQVVLNGGPPCFHLDGGRFCLRAERWEGHGVDHPYRPLDELLNSVAEAVLEEAARLAQNPYGDAVRATSRDEPKAVGLLIAAAILDLKDRSLAASAVAEEG